MEADQVTLIDTRAEIQGKLTGKDARVLGRFRGEVELQGRLSTAEGSDVEARVKADVAEIGGAFRGELMVKRLVLLEKAQVEGSIQAEVLAVREGAHVDGAVNAGVLKPAAPEPRPLNVGPRPPVKGVAGG